MSPDDRAWEVPEDLRYGPEHEWSRVDGDELTMGITDYAQEQLGSVLFLQLPDVGDTVKRGDVIAEIESAKTVSDIFCPCSGVVTATNDAVASEPEEVNGAPYDAWLVRIRMTRPEDFDELDDAQTYRGRL